MCVCVCVSFRKQSLDEILRPKRSITTVMNIDIKIYINMGTPYEQNRTRPRRDSAADGSNNLQFRNFHTRYERMSLCPNNFFTTL